MGRSVYNSTTGTWQPVARVIINGVGNIAIEVTCDSEFAGLIITATDNTTTYTQICPSTSPYKVSFEGVTPGTWTISCELDGDEYTTQAIVQDVSCALRYGFNWQEWVDTSRDLDSSDYDTIDELLADEAAVRELCLEHATVDYLASITYSDEIVEKIINNDIFAKWVNLCDYALDFLYANQIIAGLMDEADKYFYGEWALMPQVPKMTSNTMPYGEASGASVYSATYDYYKAFDGNDATHWTAKDNAANAYIYYKFINPINPKKAIVNMLKQNNPSNITISIDGSNDGSTWIPINSFTSSNGINEVDLSSDDQYLYLRVTSSGNFGQATAGYWGIISLQFYAWGAKGNVPVMTSNTTPYGEAIRSRTLNTGTEAFKAFDNDSSTYWEPTNAVPATTDYIGYKFTNPIMPKKVRIEREQHNTTQVVAFEGSNDNSTWVTIGENISMPTNECVTEATVTTNTSFLYLRIRFISQEATSIIDFSSLQFYGRELKVSVPVMTSNTAPFGEVSADSNYNDTYNKWKAFDNDSSTTWMSNHVTQSGSTATGWIQYSFVSPVCVKKMLKVLGASTTEISFEVTASNDGTTFTTIPILTTDGNYSDLDNDASYLHYRVTTTQRNGQIGQGAFPRYTTINFYGLDYSEKEFEAGTTKKWLYDHGVELETITAYTDNGTVTKSDSDIYILPAQNNNAVAEIYAPSVDMSDYSRYVISFSDRYSANTTMDVLSTAPRTLANWNTSGVVVAERAITSITDNPRHITLDVTALNSSYYPAIVIGGNSSQSRYASLNELWLE